MSCALQSESFSLILTCFSSPWTNYNILLTLFDLQKLKKTILKIEIPYTRKQERVRFWASIYFTAVYTNVKMDDNYIILHATSTSILSR